MKRNSKISLFIIGIIAVVCISAPASNTPGQEASRFSDAIREFEKFAAERMEQDRTPGLSIAFMKDDFVWAQGFGFADLENKVPAKAESSYRLASVTKTITAFAALKLVEEGKINLDAEVQFYVPYFPKKKWPVTIRQLLGHLSGISHYKNDAVEGHIKEPKDTREALAIFQDFDLVAEPGTRYNYSSYGFNLLGAVIEAASGESYGAYIQKYIFAPLGMENSRMDSPSELIPNRVRGYRLVDGVLKNSEYVDVSSRFAGGGTRSTALDLLKYARGIIEGKLVGRETQKEMFTSMAQRNGQLTGYGMGWTVRPWKGHFQVSHGGSQPETRTYISIFPSESFAVAAAANFEGTDLGPYVQRLAELVLDEDLDSAAYAPDRNRQLIYDACDVTFSYGLSQYIQAGKNLAQNDKELEEAFEYFNAHVDEMSLKKDFVETKKKILSGIHMNVNQAFTKVGTHMASVLEESFGKDKLRGYTRDGPLAFFGDYIRQTQECQGLKKAPRFKKALVELIAAWEKDWRKTYTDSLRRLSITPASNFDEIGKNLKSAFSGAVFYPDFTGDFISAAQYFLEKDDTDRVFHILNVCRDIYPNSPAPYASLAGAFVWTGNTGQAREYYRKAAVLDPTFVALGTDRFIASMGQLRRAKKLKEALDLGLLALEFRPKDARLYLETGNMFALTGQREKAAEYYKKALAIDPNLEAAKANLEKLEKK